jgi:uncharacterized protein YqeY
MKVFNDIKEIKGNKEFHRDNKIIFNLHNVILGELDRLPTRGEPTKDQIYSVIKKMYDNAISIQDVNEEAAVEADYLKDFIKKQLTDAELTEIILQYKDMRFKNIGDYMRMLNSEYKGQFDGKKASEIIKKIM